MKRNPATEAGTGAWVTVESNWENLRFVVIDLESTGLDPKRDKMISVAGVGMDAEAIFIADRFEEILPVAYNTASVTVHGITREESVSGRDEASVVADFFHWLGDGIIVGHHIQHDLSLLNISLEAHGMPPLPHLAIDTMEAYHALQEKGGFASHTGQKDYSLDALCERFQMLPHDRHTASGDAFLTAQIFLRLLKEAKRLNQWNLCDLHAWPASEPFPFLEGE